MAPAGIASESLVGSSRSLAEDVFSFKRKLRRSPEVSSLCFFFFFLNFFGVFSIFLVVLFYLFPRVLACLD